MQVPEIIEFCNQNNIFITAKPVNNGFAKIEIQNNDKIIIGNNNYNLLQKEEVYNLWYKIEELYIKYFNKIKNLKP